MCRVGSVCSVVWTYHMKNQLVGSQYYSESGVSTVAMNKVVAMQLHVQRLNRGGLCEISIY